MGSASARRLVRRAPALALAGALILAVPSCGFANALAHPKPVAEAPVGTTSASPTPDPNRVLIEDDLHRRDGVTGHLTVTAGPVVTGLVPPVPNFSDDCPVSGPSLQYVPVHIAFGRPLPVAGLAGHVTVSRGPSTPTDIGDIGIFVESSNGDERYCAHYPPLPTTDKYYNQMGAATISAYVVLDKAVTPATPQGRPDVFATLQLRFSDFRMFSDPAAQRPLTPAAPTVGALCPDDPTAICVPLG